MHIDNILAGREMDVLIATEVMGWQMVGGESGLYWDGQRNKMVPGSEIEQRRRRAFGNKLEDENPQYIFSPSTDIAAAWQVVEAFRRGVPGHAAACISINIYGNIHQPDTGVVIFGPGIATVRAWCKTVPLAVCRAALKAVGYEEVE